MGGKNVIKINLTRLSKGGRRVVPHPTLVAMRSGPKGFELKLKV